MSTQYLRILAHHSLPRAAPTLRLVSATRPSRFYQLKAHSPNQAPFNQRNSFSSSAMTLRSRYGTATFKTIPKICASEVRDKIYELLNVNPPPTCRPLFEAQNALYFDEFAQAVGISKEDAYYNTLNKLTLGSAYPNSGRTIGAISVMYVDESGHSHPMHLTKHLQRLCVQRWNAGYGKFCVHGFENSDGLGAVSELCQHYLVLMSILTKPVTSDLADLVSNNRGVKVYLQLNRPPVIEYGSAPNGPSDGPIDGFGSGGMPPFGGMPPTGGVPPMPLSLWPPIGGPEAIDRHL
ncbi:unnamed protein product [Tilletia caries]|uniref:Uncharacterized protein n=1 Tax=Tilletia caries TaxID=13290 RepID=A0A177UJR3_9BASI|nr:hypothetical protein A4X03_0g2252 [Tilletia caries]CAD6888103.1 unnamed protein product [Tilletia caries]CAD6899690.1 unnamed protein product [Tilletia caries]CAD7068475.1 unnamed protein product [Tilletia caries]